MSPLDRVAADFPTRFAGPGGAIAVLRDGETILRHAWGYANAERRIPFTPQTLFRVCSITKQFTCALLLDQTRDPEELGPFVARRLPRLAQIPPVHTLAHNQSGLRDYWAVAMLLGAPAESVFGDAEADRMFAATRSLQFAPGTRYSYCNNNFRLLSDALQERAGRPFSELLRTRILEPAGMGSALLGADTTALPDGAEGYEGGVESGFRPAINRILWTGDAGLAASLDDMIAWERHIDATRDDPQSLYGRLSAPVAFADGTPASYGWGLGRRTIHGRVVTIHGGALRGWRSQRLHVAAERLSVVVLFNHMASAPDAAMALLAAALDAPKPSEPQAPVPAWTGTYLDPDTGLAARLDTEGAKVRLHFDRHPDLLDPQADGTAAADGLTLAADGDHLLMTRPAENLRARLRPVAGPPRPGIAGRYRCAELDAELTVADAGGTLYGAFSGVLGPGRMEPLIHAAGDIWLLPMPRALDHTPPGDWTLAFHRDPDGTVPAATIGCWLARNLRYERAA